MLDLRSAITKRAVIVLYTSLCVVASYSQTIVVGNESIGCNYDTVDPSTIPTNSIQGIGVNDSTIYWSESGCPKTARSVSNEQEVLINSAYLDIASDGSNT